MKKHLQLTCGVAGDGYWGAQQCVVTGRLAFRTYEPDDNTTGFAEARLYLDEWDNDLLGLIYTDSLFIKDVQDRLHQLGFDPESIGYSESGMQGDNYVSMDASYKLAASIRDAGHDVSLIDDAQESVEVDTRKTKDQLIDECINLLTQAAATC